MTAHTKSSFASKLGFVLATAGSAVGLGNLWRFPTVAAKDGGGLFLVIYLILVFTLGYAIMTSEMALGRRTGLSALKFGFLGKLAFIVPSIILMYYVVIGGWVLEYLFVFVTGSGVDAAADGFFTSFITSPIAPVVFTLLFLALTALIIAAGVQKGIERSGKVLMPILIVLAIGIAIFSLTLSTTDADGTTRTGLEGLSILVIPNLEGLTAVAFLAGVMIIPAVFVFTGTDGLSAAGPSLMFVSLPKVFAAMGPVGGVVGAAFFLMVTLAALTSCVSILEVVVAGCMEQTHMPRGKATTIGFLGAAVGAIVVCLGYTAFYFELPLPNGSTAQILDVFDYVTNSVLMPIIALISCILFGWVLKPSWVTDEGEADGQKFYFKRMFFALIRYVAPILLVILLIQSALGL